ncbi:MAG: hypothetical protein IJG38_02295 [Thermoguttaceae bacterium]|nr:hypothetical protein [Thermoguttaceae bacterium]
MADLKFISCTQTQFNALLTADPAALTAGALYFIRDTLRIYKATSTSEAIPFSQPFIVVSSFPESNQRQGLLYILDSTKEVRSWDGNGWVVIAYPVSTAISSSSTDEQIPTAKAVYDAIDALPKTGTGSGNVPVLDSNGKLANSVIPELAISRRAGTVSAKSSLTTLSDAQVGDYAIVAGDPTEGNDGWYVLNGTYSTLTDWLQVSAGGSGGTVDQTIVENSTNAVAGGAVYSALAGKADSSHSHAASDITSGLATVATSGNYNDLTTKLQWIDL